MSKEILLQAESRNEHGSRPAGRLRREGRVPAVIYGHGVSPISVSVDAKQLRNALRTESGMNALITIKVGSDSHLALAREPQVNHVRGTLEHVDFLIVNRNEEVTAEVPLTLVGEAEGVKRGGGVLEHHLFSLPVRATPDKIPPHIEIEISHLAVGDSLHVHEIKLPEGVAADIDGDTTVVLVDVPRVVVTEEPEAATEEGAEAEGAEAAAPAAEGEAPAENA
jgi:large subunit ribosomal protein L25